MFHSHRWLFQIIRNSIRALCAQSCGKPEYHRASSVTCSRSLVRRMVADLATTFPSTSGGQDRVALFLCDLLSDGVDPLGHSAAPGGILGGSKHVKPRETAEYPAEKNRKEPVQFRRHTILSVFRTFLSNSASSEPTIHGVFPESSRQRQAHESGWRSSCVESGAKRLTKRQVQ